MQICTVELGPVKVVQFDKPREAQPAEQGTTQYFETVGSPPLSPAQMAWGSRNVQFAFSLHSNVQTPKPEHGKTEPLQQALPLQERKTGFTMRQLLEHVPPEPLQVDSSATPHRSSHGELTSPSTIRQQQHTATYRELMPN